MEERWLVLVSVASRIRLRQNVKNIKKTDIASYSYSHVSSFSVCLVFVFWSNSNDDFTIFLSRFIQGIYTF